MFKKHREDKERKRLEKKLAELRELQREREKLAYERISTRSNGRAQT